MDDSRVSISFKRDWLPLLLIVLAVCLFFLPLFSGKIIYAGDPPSISDATEVNLAFKFVLFKNIRQGNVPLWEDSISSGYPLLAESQIGFFYPLHLLFKRLPFLVAFNLQFLIHWILAAGFFYFYLRLMRLSRSACLLGAFSFVFSGYFIGHSKHLNLVEASVWLPLYLLLIEIFFLRRRTVFLLLLAPVLMLQFLAGHMQIVYYSLGFVFLYFVLRLFYIKPPQFDIRLKQKLFFLAVFMGSLFLGVGLSAIVILPAYELTAFSTRAGGLGRQAYLTAGYHLKNLIYWLFPFFYGNVAKNTYNLTPEQAGLPWETMSYIGLIPFLLALFAVYKAIFTRRFKQPVFLWAIIFSGSLLFILSLNGKIGYIFWYLIPGLSSFRAHARLVLISVMAAAILSAFGLDYFLWFFRKRIYLSKIAAGLVIVLTLLNLFYVNYNFNSFFDGRRWLEEPNSVHFLKQDKSLFRILSFGLDYTYNDFYQQSGRGWLARHYLFFNNREQLQPNTNAIFGIDNVESTVGLSLYRHAVLFSLAKKFGVLTDLIKLDYPRENQVVLKDEYLKILGMQNVKYLLTFYNLKNKNLTLAHRVKFRKLQMPLNIYRNDFWLPRAYLVDNIKLSVPIKPENEIQAGARLLAEKIDFSKTALVESGLKGLSLENGEASSGQVKILQWHNGVISLTTTAPRKSFLVISNSFYPGWRAYLDGRPVKIYPTDYLYHGLLVPAGKHHVQLHFHPRSVQIGRIISFVSVFILALLLISYVFYYAFK